MQRSAFLGVAVALALTRLFAPACSCAQEPAPDRDPKTIFEKVESAYKALDTYTADGTVATEIDSGPQKIRIDTSFSIKLKKPNLYLITWKQTNAAMPAMSQAGAVWNDGTQPYLYMGIMNAYSKMVSDQMALSGATGISGGAAFTVPSLFLSAFPGQPSTFSRLVDPKLAPDETLDGEDCYVIEGSSNFSKKETFWISKKSFLLQKTSRSLEPPPGGVKQPELTDAQLEESIKELGQEVTPERIQAMRARVTEAKKAMQNIKLKGSATESHGKIASPALTAKDFSYQVPQNTVLKESLFSDFLDRKPPPPTLVPPSKAKSKAKAPAEELPPGEAPPGKRQKP
jgi:hypothetical protein